MEDKSKQIQKMFDNIAPKYDLLNRLLSFRRDVYWRKKAISLLNIKDDMLILDLACGTGDMTVELKKKYKSIKVIGTDFSKNMLDLAKSKVNNAALVNGDAHFLPFKDQTFDRVMIAFGFRNVVRKDVGLIEIYRVLKPGGVLCILEFSQPEGTLFSKIYRLYFLKILPLIGGLISGNRSAYSYLPESVYQFPNKTDYKTMITNAGFRRVDFNYMTFGICNAAICYK
ncbi:MAG: bifunctional demethylmenaquinone methyltransferase/2-methoxy-6-polyprenyl-1,4-benzoquinol methylase UbiE [Calditerrivibrio sp.]|nr:bifunctional demethylmenaquinone methyltransferase/2-methoxy-6-polyprenyl-1,4-benzoquinol methylase UbiE [Calditerrivibrio sp.]